MVPWGLSAAEHLRKLELSLCVPVLRHQAELPPRRHARGPPLSHLRQRHEALQVLFFAAVLSSAGYGTSLLIRHETDRAAKDYPGRP